MIVARESGKTCRRQCCAHQQVWRKCTNVGLATGPELDQRSCPVRASPGSVHAGRPQRTRVEATAKEVPRVCGQIHGVVNMLDKNYWLSGSEGSGASATSEPDEPASPPGENPVCCAKPMNARLAHARDGKGQELFLAVWHCQVCGRVVPGGS